MLRYVVALAVIIGFVSQAQAINLSCTDSLNALNKKGVKELSVTCPVNCKSGSVWGTDTYTTDSALCVAAVHAGMIGKKGGTVKVATFSGKSSYAGTTRNGVATSSWGSFDRSFKFVVDKK